MGLPQGSVFSSYIYDLANCYKLNVIKLNASFTIMIYQKAIEKVKAAKLYMHAKPSHICLIV